MDQAEKRQRFDLAMRWGKRGLTHLMSSLNGENKIVSLCKAAQCLELALDALSPDYLTEELGTNLDFQQRTKLLIEQFNADMEILKRRLGNPILQACLEPPFDPRVVKVEENVIYVDFTGSSKNNK